MPKFLRWPGSYSVKTIALAVLSFSALTAVAAPSHAHRHTGASSLAAEASERSAELIEHLREGASDMVTTAVNFIGVRYRFGGNSAEQGFDCSGFTRKVFEASLGLLLPRRAEQQARAPGLTPVARDDLQPGDLVFFNTLRRTFSHVGIYVGDGKFIHAPKPGGEVRIDDMRFVYWAKRFTGARRAEAMADQPETDLETEVFRAPGLDASPMLVEPLETTSLRSLLNAAPASARL